MGYFNHLIRGQNHDKSDIHERLEVMTEDELKSVLENMKESFPAVEDRVKEDRIERIESNIHLFEAQIHELEAEQKLFGGAIDENSKAIRRLCTAVIAFASGFVAYVSAQIILSLV